MTTPERASAPLERELADAIERAGDFLGRMEHRRWCADHLISGYRHEPVKRKLEKAHPCLVPWDDLTQVRDERTAENPQFYQQQACRMSGIIPKLIADIRLARTRER
jgi:hypothetical protein